MRVVVIIQARMTSSRLPGKVMMDLSGEAVLSYMLKRVQKAALVDDIVVATTTNQTDDDVVNLCEALDVRVYRGSEPDVLGRFYLAASEAKAEVVVRLTADCPMIDPAIIDEVISVFSEGGCDYASNTVIRTYPDGLDVEVMSIQALKKAHENAVDDRLREHVTPYINGKLPALGDGGFKKKDIVFKADFAHIRWTLDTKDDLECIRQLVSHLPAQYHWLEALSVATKYKIL
ncbi:MAG: glycosyltransferase family protein [Methylococcales bacterium]|jgi:spore coat polysaccharide biosynthesis protein SpsF|nr:glycosyltransferase family protein [Methylococcales bacterium]